AYNLLVFHAVANKIGGLPAQRSVRPEVILVVPGIVFIGMQSSTTPINNQLHPVPSARNPPQGGSLCQTAPQAPRSGAQSLIGPRDRPATCASRERAAERGRLRTQRSIRDRDDLTALRYPAELKPCQSRHIQSRKVRAQRANRVDRPPRRNRAQTLCKPPSPDALAPCAGTQVSSPTCHILSHAVLSRSEFRRALLAQRDCQES